MSFESSACCDCGLGCGLPEVGAGKITGVRGNPARPSGRAAARTLARGLVASGQEAA
jgi:assimilatory nitrate reductase catalytic subunit